MINPNPNQIFTIVIWDEDRAKFGKPPETYYKSFNKFL
jgi:hypothetical protein